MDDYHDLKYKFDFMRLSVLDIFTAGHLAQLAKYYPEYSALANKASIELIEKVSVIPIAKIPADMISIFLKEYNEAFRAWAKEVGILPGEEQDETSL